MKMKKGFVLVIVVSFISVLLLIVWVVVNIGCSEILQTRTSNDLSQAYYAASAGAERMYALMRTISNGNATVTWPQIDAQHDVITIAGGTVVGTYTASATTMDSTHFGIVSQGLANGRTAVVTAKYGFDSPITLGIPLGSAGPMTLNGQKFLFLRSWVRADGPIESNSTITKNSNVQVTGDILENQNLIIPDFWINPRLNTTGVTVDADSPLGYGDYNDDGAVTPDEVLPIGAANFAANDINNDNVINDKDAFFYYYTVYLNDPANNPLGQDLGIAPGGVHYYTGDQSFNPWSVPEGTPIIFVDGDVDILFSDTSWWGGSGDHTVIATGTITITQPTNGSNDRLTLVSYGDCNTGGVRAFGGVRGELVVYTNSDFNAYYGGRTNGTMFAKDNVNVDTVAAIPGLLNRDLKKGSRDWSDPASWPLGIPPNFATVSPSFSIKDETKSSPQGYVPRWQQD
ncbi:MAG: hypothetical protein WC779_05550 [Candidatus Omnitrophota bacterium]|jgi:hypothetical protein